ncbi:CARDB domain-containing protein [Massilia putida]|uniref:CARDB domain-containing protein n=1 Tax=Massilia putida TaxID=1141883 RepID=UPI0009F914FD|nr:CARDB domain-containing protein [Massilia putida]
MRTKWSVLPLTLAVLYSGLPGLAGAATPAAGTVTDRNTSTTYAAGPFLVPNTSGLAGPVTCNAVLPCDDFKLTVDVPAAYAADHNLTVRVQWANSTADFDLYVLDEGGNVVGSAASSSDPEVAVLPAIAGTYTVRVVPYAPLGDSIAAAIELTPKPVPATPGSGTPPSYTSYQPPAGSGLGTTAGEPSIGANWKSGKVMFQSNTQTLRVTFNDSVSPASAVWEAKSAAPPACTAVTGLDPILWTDSKLGRTIESQLLANPLVNSLSCYTDDDAETWTPTQGGGVGQGVDHQSIGGGPYVSGMAPVLATFPHAVYYCSQSIALATCARSDNGGLTYGPSMPVYTIEQCGGLHGHVKVAPDGTVYLPNKSCGGRQGVAVSTDNGMIWTLRTIPNSTAGESDPSVGIGSDGTVYFGYQNGDGHPRVAVSRDRGATWTDDQDISAPFGVQNVAFPAVVAGDGDRAAFAYLGTTTAGNYQDAGFSGLWHLYVAHTYDGGKSWITTDATPSDPVQAGCIWLGGGSNPCRNLLDFMDATVDAQGRVLVGYADGCTQACATNPSPNDDPANGYHSELATIARQADGKRMFARFDQPDLVVTSVRSSQLNSKAILSATVANKGTSAANGTVVQFMEDTSIVGSSAPVNLEPGASTEVSIVWPTTRTRGTHVITAIADPGNTVSESDESNNKTQASVYFK